MAEQDKESSPAERKGKKLSLDDEIGKEFLSSWKSMSMADDDAMDFSFDTVSKGKKKTFDFDKLDMSFNLDGEFDKISSFKLDMSDLDFTCPHKNSQSKDKKGEVSGEKSGKQDGFNFSFDFNNLDSFNLDSSFMKVDTTSSGNSRRKGVTAEGSDKKEGAKMPKTNDDEDNVASNYNTGVKSHPSERLETSNVETMVGSLGNLVSKQDGSVSKISSSGNLDTPMENQTLDIVKHKSTEEVDQERDLPEKAKLTESKSQHVINMACSQSVGQSNSEQHSVSDQHTEVLSSGTRVSNASGDKQEVNDKPTYQYQCTRMFSSGTREINVSGNIQDVNDKASNVNSDSVDIQLDHSSPHHITQSDSSVGKAITLGSSIQEGVTNDSQSEKRYLSCENIDKADALKMISCENDNSENKKTSVCHLTPSSSKPVVEKMMPMKDKKLQDMQSNMFSMPEDKRSLKQPSSTVGSKGISLGNQKNVDMLLGSITRENLRSNDTRLGSKLVGDSLTDSSKLTRDAAALLGSKDDLKSSSNTREGTVSDVTPCLRKLAGNKQSFCEEVNKSKTTFLESGMSTKDVSLLSSQVNPPCLTEKTPRITTHVSVNFQPEASGKESSKKSRITSIEGNKLASFKICKITPALSSLNTSRNFVDNRVLTTLHQKESNSLVSSGQSMEVMGITASKSDHLIGSGDNQKPSTPFLKRKTIEVSEADFTSSSFRKRIAQSPTKSRNCKESSEEVVREVESLPNNSGLKSPPEIKLTEVEIPDSVLIEDNSNVEKAEAYMKELEDICNMLKKRHEEAKELLIRAIVNDNNLLMLNHPIYEEEFRKVQKFASQLISKGFQT